MPATATSTSVPRRLAIAALIVATLGAALPGAAAVAGTPESDPRGLTNAGGTLVFFASTGPAGVEPWRSKGSAATTSLLLDIQPGGTSSNPSDVVSLGGRAYFSAEGPTGRELWRSDGTTAGTRIVKDLNGAGDGTVHDIVRAGSTLFFVGAKNGAGRELFVSDGTRAGTRLVKDILPGGAWGMVPGSLVGWGSKALFLADDGTGIEVWRSDGTATGTRRVRDLTVGGGSLISLMTPAGDRFFFVREAPAGVFSLWKSNGRKKGTVKVAVLPVRPIEMVAVGRNVLFKGYDGSASQLWRSDGTAGGTVALTSSCAGDSGVAPEQLTAFKGRAYFMAFGPGDCADMELWRSNGTVAGTKRFKELNPSGRGDPGGFKVIGDRLYFSARDAAGLEPWRSDGTKAGTVRIADVVTGSGSSTPTDFTKAGSIIYFSATDSRGRELWKLTGSGAALVEDINP